MKRYVKIIKGLTGVRAIGVNDYSTFQEAQEIEPEYIDRASEVVRILSAEEENEYEDIKKELETIKALTGEKIPDIQTVTTTGKLPEEFDKKEFAWKWYRTALSQDSDDTPPAKMMREEFLKLWKEQE